MSGDFDHRLVLTHSAGRTAREDRTDNLRHAGIVGTRRRRVVVRATGGGAVHTGKGHPPANLSPKAVFFGRELQGTNGPIRVNCWAIGHEGSAVAMGL